MNNRCVLDSVLWFHLECPKDVAKFDNSNDFKRKFRDFFAETRSVVDLYTAEDEDSKEIKKQYDFIAYPEDAYPRKEIKRFEEEFKKFSPIYHPEAEDDLETEEEDEMDEDTPLAEIDYVDYSDVTRPKPISKEDSLKFKKK